MDSLHTTIKFYEVKASLSYKRNQKLRELARWPLASTCVLFSRYVFTAEVIDPVPGTVEFHWLMLFATYQLPFIHTTIYWLYSSKHALQTLVTVTAYSDSNTFCGDNRGSKITVLWREGWDWEPTIVRNSIIILQEMSFSLTSTSRSSLSMYIVFLHNL